MDRINDSGDDIHIELEVELIEKNTNISLRQNIKLWVYLAKVYLGVKTCEVFLCFVAIVRVRVCYVDFFVFFVLYHWWVLQVLTPRMSQTFKVVMFHYLDEVETLDDVETDDDVDKLLEVDTLVIKPGKWITIIH